MTDSILALASIAHAHCGAGFSYALALIFDVVLTSDATLSLESLDNFLGGRN